MQSVDRWRPSKIVFDTRKQRYVPNGKHVALGSRLAVHAMLPTYVEAMQTHTRGRLLDCGCGTAPYFSIYRDHVDEVVCIDWAQSVHRNIHVDHEVDLSGQLPFEAGRFDTVLLADVLEHIKVPAQLIAEIARVLAPGGKLILTVPFLYNVHEAPHDYYRFTRYAIEDLTQRAGLRLVSLEAFGGYPDILCDLLNKGFAKVFPLGHMFTAIAPWWTRRGFYQRWRARTRERYPLGYCCVAQK
jgi:SAM-dependent methyltransferase